MAAKSPTELIREVRTDVNLVIDRVETLRQEVGPLRNDMVSVRERLAKLEERSDKLARDRDESSRRWVQFGLLAAGAAVTVGVQLLIRWVGK